MDVPQSLRRAVKDGRKRRAFWVRVLDVLRLVPTSEGRARLWTRLLHGDRVHQATPHTREERYPELFDLAARLMPNADRILSFGCSTGEELLSLRRRFPAAQIVGAEINHRSRRIAARRVAGDPRTIIVGPGELAGGFDVVFALAVLQREPHRVAELGVQDLSNHYPFRKFDVAVGDMVARLPPGGLLCVMHTHYLVEHSSVADQLDPIEQSPAIGGPFFGRDGQRLEAGSAPSIYRKR